VRLHYAVSAAVASCHPTYFVVVIMCVSRSWDPMRPDGTYSLDLSCWEDRVVAHALTQLAVAEPGENWVGMYPYLLSPVTAIVCDCCLRLRVAHCECDRHCGCDCCCPSQRRTTTTSLAGGCLACGCSPCRRLDCCASRSRPLSPSASPCGRRGGDKPRRSSPTADKRTWHCE
jgi:hypothetical protein